MRKSRFTESQIVAILKQGEAGVPIAGILRQHNISKATYGRVALLCLRTSRQSSNFVPQGGNVSLQCRERLSPGQPCVGVLGVAAHDECR